jgi:hypothetical protein
VDEKTFKKHLTDLAHGHHHPEEHDWSTGSGLRIVGKATPAKRTSAAKPAKKKAAKRAKRKA